MTTKEILTDARRLIEKGWTQFHFACDVNGMDVDPTNPNACGWCAMGAIWAVTGYDMTGTYMNTCRILNDLIDFNSIFQFNDYAETTQDDVIALYDKAIASCE